MRSIQETQLMKIDGVWEDIQFGMTVQIEEGVEGILKSVKFTQDVLESLSDEEDSEPKPGPSRALKIWNLGKNHESPWYCTTCDIRFPKEKKYLRHMKNHSFCFICGELVFNLDEEPRDLACDNCTIIRNREEALRNGKTDTMGSTNPTRKIKLSDEPPCCFVCSMILENADATLEPHNIICENCTAMESVDQYVSPIKGKSKGILIPSSDEDLTPLVILEEKSEPKPGPSRALKIGNPGKNHESEWYCSTCDIRFPKEEQYLRHITNHSLCHICGQLVFNLDKEREDLVCDKCAEICKLDEAPPNGKTKDMGSTNPTKKRKASDEPPSCFVCSMILEDTDATRDSQVILCENCAAEESDDQSDTPMKKKTEGILNASSEEGLKRLVIREESDGDVEIKQPSCCMCSKILEGNLKQGGKQVCDDCIQACLMGVFHGKAAKVDNSAEESSQQSTQTERGTGESDVDVEMISDDPDMDAEEEEPEDDYDVFDWSPMKK